MASKVVHILESYVRELLTWESTLEAVELALKSVTEKRAVQNARSITKLPNTNNSLFTMPAYLEAGDFKALACKLVTAFPVNVSLPSIMATILLFDERTGELQAIIAGTEITAWRTAAASAVATKHLHLRHPDRKSDVLTILGAGAQGTTHAVAFQKLFNFKEVRVWNHSAGKGAEAVRKLNSDSERPGKYVYFERLDECVREADVIVTATYAPSPILKMEHLKKGVHINAVGAGSNVYELEESIYRNAFVYVDNVAGAKDELEELTKAGIDLTTEIGAVINGTAPVPGKDATTVFQSLGMAAEDCAMARMVYNKHLEKRQQH